VNNEVPVAQLLVRDGRNQSGPLNARSRWRVIAVMLAVVLGCGAAAVMVRVGSSARQQAQPTEQIGIIQMPQRTNGAAGADTTPDPESSAGVPGGNGAGVHVSATNTSADQSSAAGSPSDPANPVDETSATTGTSTSGATTTGTSTSVTGQAGPTSAPPPPHPPTPTRHQQPPPTTKSPCFLGIFC
jgi:hypothetical protein